MDLINQQKLPFSYNAVFDGVVAIIPKIGFSLNTQDRSTGRITASTGPSLVSWGENLTIVVKKIDDKNTLVALVESTFKAGIQGKGSFRQEKNFNTLIEGISSHLGFTPEEVNDINTFSKEEGALGSKLIKCKACGATVSMDAKSCPGCGSQGFTKGLEVLNVIQALALLALAACLLYLGFTILS